MKITVAKYAGFCFGVRRAVDVAEKALEENKKPIYSLGPIIHNPQVVKMLEEKGMIVVENPEDIPDRSLFVIRSHGISPQIIEKLKSRGVEILDATCPFVKKTQEVARKFYEKKYTVVICGDAKHAEVVAINAYTENSAIIVNDTTKLRDINVQGKVGVLSQTTQKISLLKETISQLLNSTKHLEIENTICLDSATKQKEVQILAGEVDAMVVIGGKNSSNTTKLAELSRAAKIPTYHIETAAEIQKEWFWGINNIGIAAGASTAPFLVDEVVKEIMKS